MIGLLSKDETASADGLKLGFQKIEGDAGFGSYRGRGEPEAPEEPPLSQVQKAAIILSTLAPEASAQMLRTLSEDEVRLFVRATGAIGDLKRETVKSVIDEFVGSLEIDGLQAMTPDRLKRMLAGVMSDTQIERLLEDIDESEGRSVWQKLSQADIGELSTFLSREHPQTVAVVISKMDPDRSAKIMMKFEPEFTNEVVMRLSKVSQLTSEVMDAVKTTLEDEFLRNARQGKMKRRPDEMIGSILNFMTSDKRNTIMKTIEEQSASLATAVQRKMFTFGDIPKRVDRAAVSTIVRECDNAELIRALAHAQKTNPETVEYFFNSISKRLGEQLREAIDDRPKPTAKEGDEAQFKVVELIRRLSDTNVITLNLGDDDEDEAQ